MAKERGRKNARIEKRLADVLLTQEGAECAARTAREQLVRSTCLVDLAEVRPDTVRQQALDYATAADVLQSCQREASALRMQLL